MNTHFLDKISSMVDQPSQRISLRKTCKSINMISYPDNWFNIETDGTCFGNPIIIYYYRFIMALYFSTTLFHSIYQDGWVAFLQEYQYLTIWGVTMTTFYYIIISIWRPRGPKFVRFARAYNFTVLVNECMISTFYWSILYTPGQFNWANVSDHALCTLSRLFYE